MIDIAPLVLTRQLSDGSASEFVQRQLSSHSSQSFDQCSFCKTKQNKSKKRKCINKHRHATK